MAEPVLCLICRRRPRTRKQTCDACPARIARLLADIPDLYADLIDQDDVTELGGVLIVDDGTFDAPHAYDVVTLLPAPIAGARTGGPVSGSRDAPVPVNLDLVDLTAPARAGSVLPHANGDARQRAAAIARTKTWELHDYAGHWDDQIGHLSVATTLDTWVRDWRDARGNTEGWPAATVAGMCRWLADRADDACDNHPAVDEFAADLERVHRTLRGVLGLVGPWPELLGGVPCRHCDTAALYRLPVGHYGQQQYIECGECGDLMTPEECERWTQLVAASVRGRGRMSA